MQLFFDQLKNCQAKISSHFNHQHGVLITRDEWTSTLGNGITCSLEGDVIEKGGINVSFVKGDAFPASGRVTKGNLSGFPFMAAGLSMIFHAKNPYVPTAHFNIRKLSVFKDGVHHSWFGGGFDLTPYFPFLEDCQFWHQKTKSYLDRFDHHLYPAWKIACDEYFYIRHRKEHRGIGGIFFDDFLLNEDYGLTEQLVLGLFDVFFNMYCELINKRHLHSYSVEQKNFQNWRQGRYVEFNLLYDRGTQFGLQSNGRIESILISLPKNVQWLYKGDEIYNEYYQGVMRYLKPRDWVASELLIN